MILKKLQIILLRQKLLINDLKIKYLKFVKIIVNYNVEQKCLINILMDKDNLMNYNKYKETEKL